LLDYLPLTLAVVAMPLAAANLLVVNLLAAEFRYVTVLKVAWLRSVAANLAAAKPAAVKLLLAAPLQPLLAVQLLLLQPVVAMPLLLAIAAVILAAIAAAVLPCVTASKLVALLVNAANQAAAKPAAAVVVLLNQLAVATKQSLAGYWHLPDAHSTAFRQMPCPQT
jgi:hypothetical protein